MNTRQATEEEISRAAEELRCFVGTDEYRDMLRILREKDQKICFHSYEDGSIHLEFLYLTGEGFVAWINDHNKAIPLTSWRGIIGDFLMGYCDMAPYAKSEIQSRAPQDFIPWLRSEIASLR